MNKDLQQGVQSLENRHIQTNARGSSPVPVYREKKLLVYGTSDYIEWFLK